jgi:hypothetical protein
LSSIVNRERKERGKETVMSKAIKKRGGEEERCEK